MNREFVVTYSLLADNIYKTHALTFRTMKHFSDWFNENHKTIIVISIAEVEGDPSYDKYFKEDKK